MNKIYFIENCEVLKISKLWNINVYNNFLLPERVPYVMNGMSRKKGEKTKVSQFYFKTLFSIIHHLPDINFRQAKGDSNTIPEDTSFYNSPFVRYQLPSGKGRLHTILEVIVESRT